MTNDLRKKNRVWIEAWDDGDHIITVDGSPVGMADSERELRAVRYWLEHALTEIEMRAVARFQALQASQEKRVAE